MELFINFSNLVEMQSKPENDFDGKLLIALVTSSVVTGGNVKENGIGAGGYEEKGLSEHGISEASILLNSPPCLVSNMFSGS